MSDTICQKIKCDELSEDGDPAWCSRAGCPAVVAVGKCPKVTGNQNMNEGENHGKK